MALRHSAENRKGSLLFMSMNILSPTQQDYENIHLNTLKSFIAQHPVGLKMLSGVLIKM
jgi:hypothetical protein